MSIQLATHNDGQFILELIVRNSKKHFNAAFIDIKYQKSLVEQIKRTISDGLCPMPQAIYQSKIKVAVKNGEPAGFLWTLQKTKQEIELYILAVSPEHRRTGYAEMLIKEALLNLTPGTTVTSRVKRKSREMKHLLRKLNFEGQRYFPFKTQTFTRIIS